MNRSYYAGRRTMQNARTTYANCPCTNVAAESHQTDCDEMVLAMAYVLVQDFVNLYEPDAAFSRGTVFADLDKPFMAGGVSCG